MKILHVGNIANNAYLNAKLLIRHGIESEVICYDYFHIMGCPEWEDADFSGIGLDHFSPDWTQRVREGYVRPEWFAQGRFADCAAYLIARSAGLKNSQSYWDELLVQCKLKKSDVAAYKKSKAKRIYGAIVNGIQRVNSFLALPDLDTRLPNAISRRRGQSKLNSIYLRFLILFVAIPIVAMMRAMRALLCRINTRIAYHDAEFDRRVEFLVSKWEALFPDRIDKLTHKDLEHYRSVYPLWKTLFNQYDLIHAYSTDPILPLLTGHPYVAYEHGTIRNIPFVDDRQGRLCALAYRMAPWVVVTNADNMSNARRLGVERFSFVPHPVNEDFLPTPDSLQLVRKSLVKNGDTDFVIFHPSRQHWTLERHPDWEKGNDIFIRGFAKFVHEVNPHAEAILVDWGATVKESRSLIEALGISDRISWVPPMGHREMTKYIAASDVVADQFFLGAFGSTLPKSLLMSKIGLIYLDPVVHQECFEKSPPVANVKSENDVFNALRSLYEKAAAAVSLAKAGRDWYEEHHSNAVIASKLVSIYQHAIEYAASQPTQK